MKQNKNFPWKCTSLQQQQGSPVGYRDFTTSEAEQTHKLPERAFGFTATESAAWGNLHLPKTAMLSNLWSVHPSGKIQEMSVCSDFKRKISSLEATLGSSGLICVSIWGPWKSGCCEVLVPNFTDLRNSFCSGNMHNKTGVQRELSSAPWGWEGPSSLFALKLRPWLCSGFRNHYFILGRTVQNDISCFVF